MEMQFLGFGMFIGGLIGLICGIFIAATNIEREAYQRGYMVECIGKSGYYWECE